MERGFQLSKRQTFLSHPFTLPTLNTKWSNTFGRAKEERCQTQNTLLSTLRRRGRGEMKEQIMPGGEVLSLKFSGVLKMKAKENNGIFRRHYLGTRKRASREKH